MQKITAATRNVYQFVLPESVRSHIYTVRSNLGATNRTKALELALESNRRLLAESWFLREQHARERLNLASQALVERLGSDNVSLIVAHDFGALPAAVKLKIRCCRSASVIFDNVEHPLHQNRTTTKIRQYFLDNPDDCLWANKGIEIHAEYADYIFTSCPGYTDFYQQLGHKKVHTVPLGKRQRSLDGRRKIRSDANCTSTSDKLILYLNHVYSDGGGEECIAALKHLPANYKLGILGKIKDEDAQSRIDQLLRDPDLQSRVFFLPLVPPGDVVNHIAGADCIAVPLNPAHPGHAVSWPNRLLQAIAAQRPLVVPSGTSYATLVDQEKNGVVFAEFKPISIASSFLEACGLSETDDFAERARATAKKYCWESNEPIIKNVVDELCGDRRGTALVISRKRAEVSDRVQSYASTLRAIGFDVKVMAMSEPDRSIRVPGVDYYVLKGSQLEFVKSDPAL